MQHMYSSVERHLRFLGISFINTYGMIWSWTCLDELGRPYDVWAVRINNSLRRGWDVPDIFLRLLPDIEYKVPNNFQEGGYLQVSVVHGLCHNMAFCQFLVSYLIATKLILSTLKKRKKNAKISHMVCNMRLIVFHLRPPSNVCSEPYKHINTHTHI